MDSRGQATEMWLWVIVLLILLMFFGLVAPILQNLTAGMYLGTQPILNNTQLTINQYTDTNLQASATEVITAQQNSVGTNLQIYGSLYTYGALLTIIIIFIGYWLITKKKIVEQGSGGVIG
jgi:hypothetical protein